MNKVQSRRNQNPFSSSMEERWVSDPEAATSDMQNLLDSEHWDSFRGLWLKRKSALLKNVPGEAIVS